MPVDVFLSVFCCSAGKTVKAGVFIRTHVQEERGFCLISVRTKRTVMLNVLGEKMAVKFTLHKEGVF